MAEKSSVLVVDDTPENLHLLMDLLKDEYVIWAAKDGAKALQLAYAKKPDIILLDVMMPGMNGYETIEWLKSRDETKDIPVIFITSLSEADDEAKGLALGAVDYIIKPFFPGIVKARIKTHLALYDQNRALEEQVELRTRELKASKDKAEAASRAKSAFLANVSHEFRTPLNHIQAGATMLHGSALGNSQQEMVKVVMDGVKRLNDLFSQIMELTQLESQPLEPRLTPCSLHKFFDGLALNFEDEAQKYGLGFKCSVRQGVPQNVVCDANLIRKILRKIFANACRYSKQGSIKLEIQLDNGYFPGANQNMAMVRFSLSDNGVGIPKDKLETIFDSFEIGEDYMTKRLSGAGLGLAIAKVMAVGMGGKIWAESQPGEGSTFHVSLPMLLDPPVV